MSTAMADEDISPYISWPGKTQCPWILFHANALTLLDTLHGETCSPQAKINKFITAAKHRFARSPTRGKKSKKQASKVIHIPGVSSYKQKDTVTNRQSRQLAATSCRDRSPTPHPYSRSKAETREPCEPTPDTYRARSPTPPWGCTKANTRSFLQSNHAFYIDIIQLHHNTTHNTVNQPVHTDNSSFQDEFRCIPGPSTRKRVSSSRIPIPSKLQCHNLASSHDNKPQSCYKGVSHIPVPHGRVKHIVKSNTQDHAYEDACFSSDTDSVDSLSSDTDSVDSIHDQIKMPRDTTATNKVHDSQGDTRVITQNQDLRATRQPKQHRTSQLTETSPSRSTLPSQNTPHHIKQCIPGPLSAKYNTGPPPVLPRATTSRPQHIAIRRQWPALLPTPARSRSPIIPSSRQQLPVPSPTFNHLSTPFYHEAVTKSPHLTPLYLPVIVLTLTNKFTKLLCQQGYPDTTHQKQYVHKGIQTDTITPLWRHKLNSYKQAWTQT